MAIALGLPAAFQAAIAIEPKTEQRRVGNPALAFRVAKTQKVVIGRGTLKSPARATQRAAAAEAGILHA